MRETVDNIAYVTTPCVGCGAPMLVSEAALKVVDQSRWPKCTTCWKAERAAA